MNAVVIMVKSNIGIEKNLFMLLSYQVNGSVLPRPD